MPRELMSSDEPHAHSATAAPARATAEDVHAGVPEAVTELAVAALTYVKQTVGKLFDTERRRQRPREIRDARQLLHARAGGMK
jgi:hypothetical protein